jgi:hypothetical protein
MHCSSESKERRNIIFNGMPHNKHRSACLPFCDDLLGHNVHDGVELTWLKHANRRQESQVVGIMAAEESNDTIFE